ncbi:MAG TPA: DnaJ domain-containing protein [Stellaceae bacterium]|nr:DnaJ domain-containing protein [Stellaceae bacterium]
MLYLLGGFAVLSGFLLLVYLFVNADPARLARGLKVTGIVVAVAAVATLAISGRLAAILMPVAMLMPLLIRVRSLLDRYRPPAAGQTSTVATAFLRMTLDHDTGSMEGTILRGRFAGMRLDELGAADLLALLRECRAEDEEGARLLEAYLERIHPQWREELAGERAGGGAGARSTSGDMSVDEAYAILGLSAGADAEAIKEAHRRLMVKLHPDHGGSDYLATKINRARDVLLHK